MDLFSKQGCGCLAATLVLVGAGLTLPFTIASSSIRMLLETKEVTVSPGAVFSVDAHLVRSGKGEKFVGASTPGGPKGGPTWSFDGPADGRVLGGNDLGMRIQAPS